MSRKQAACHGIARENQKGEAGGERGGGTVSGEGLAFFRENAARASYRGLGIPALAGKVGAQLHPKAEQGLSHLDGRPLMRGRSVACTQLGPQPPGPHGVVPSQCAHLGRGGVYNGI